MPIQTAGKPRTVHTTSKKSQKKRSAPKSRKRRISLPRKVSRMVRSSVKKVKRAVSRPSRKVKRAVRKTTGKLSRWNRFQKKHSGKGLTPRQLRNMYRKEYM